MLEARRNIVLVFLIACLIFSYPLKTSTGSTSSSYTVELTNVSDIQTGGVPVAIQIYNNLLYIADHRGLFIFNVTDPSNPIKLGENLDGGTGHDICVDNGYAYIGDLSDGFEVYDVSDPTNPQKIGTFFDGIDVAKVYIQNSICYVTANESMFALLNVSNPADIELLSQTEVTAGLDIQCSEDIAVIADWQNGVLLYDISNPNIPLLIGCYNSSETFRSVFIEGDVVYASCKTNGVKIISISQPTSPTLLGEFTDVGDQIGAIGVSKQGKFLFVCDYDEGLKVVNINSPETPVISGFYGGSRIFAVKNVGEYVYIIQSTTSGGGIHILHLNEKNETTSFMFGSMDILFVILCFSTIILMRNLYKRR